MSNQDPRSTTDTALTNSKIFRVVLGSYQTFLKKLTLPDAGISSALLSVFIAVVSNSINILDN